MIGLEEGRKEIDVDYKSVVEALNEAEDKNSEYFGAFKGAMVQVAQLARRPLGQRRCEMMALQGGWAPH